MLITLQSNRLLIRRFNDNGWKGLFDYLSDPAVIKYETHHEKSEEECKSIAKDFSLRDDCWAICLLDTNALIGHFFFGESGLSTWSIGFVINQTYRRQGYATEATGLILKHAFLVKKAHRVDAFSDSRNKPSWKTLEGLGFKKEGTLREHVFHEYDTEGNPIWINSYVYSILDYEWAAHQSSKNMHE